tara:strand:- start:82 stop:234 length:153 start_codon:yes stop_codon:yes gene_type:complete
MILLYGSRKKLTYVMEDEGDPSAFLYAGVPKAHQKRCRRLGESLRVEKVH